MTNTSENTVYSLKIILKYAGEKVERTNRYAFDSLYSKQAILLVTDERIPEGGFVDLQIKFRTAANELGYYHFHVDVAGNFTEYTFVKDKEPVSVYGDDVLADKESKEVKELEEKFKEPAKEKYSYTNVTITEEAFSDLKRYIHEKKN